MTNKVVDVINTLCDKFGVTTQYLLAEMGRYYLASTTTIICITTILLILSSFIFVVSLHKYREASNSSSWDGEEFYTIVSVISGVIAFVVLIIFLCFIGKFIGLLISPTGATIDTILGTLKK